MSVEEYFEGAKPRKLLINAHFAVVNTLLDLASNWIFEIYQCSLLHLVPQHLYSWSKLLSDLIKQLVVLNSLMIQVWMILLTIKARFNVDNMSTTRLRLLPLIH